MEEKMTAKEYLIQIRKMERMIGIKLQRLQYWREMSLKVSGCPSKENMDPNRHIDAPFVRAYARISEIEEELDKEISSLREYREWLMGLIGRMPDHDERQVIELRYVHGLSWEDVSHICGYSLRWTYHIHKRGLCSLDRIMKEEGNGLQ